MDRENIISKNKSDTIQKKRINRWGVFGILCLLAAMTIGYVSNVMKIDELLSDVQILNKKYEILKNSNEILETNINQLQSADRIIKIAQDELGMIKSEKMPEIVE